MDVLHFIFFFIIGLAVTLNIALIFVRKEPLQFILFLLSSLLTLSVDAMLIISLHPKDETLRIIAYSCGIFVIMIIMLRMFSTKLSTFSNIFVAIIFIIITFCAFFLR